jgi:hypothetical protein
MNDVSAVNNHDGKGTDGNGLVRNRADRNMADRNMADTVSSCPLFFCPHAAGSSSTQSLRVDSHQGASSNA